MFFDNKAQAGSVFKILIGAVIGIAIFGIIYSIIIIMGNQKAYLSEEIFSNKIKMAMKNPISKEYFIDNYNFDKGKVLSKNSLSEQTGLAKDCISLYKNTSQQNIILTNNEENIVFDKANICTIGIKCTIGSTDNCPILCDLTIYDRGYKSN